MMKEWARFWSDLEVNVIIGKCWNEEIFFGPIYDFDTFHRYEDTTLLDLLVEHNFFPSKSQARKSNWDKEIQPGWNVFTVGKKKRTLYIYKESNE